MRKLLYLDTARLGQMSPRARRASVGFARFASEYGCSLYLNEFLLDGFDAWPQSLREDFAELADWKGVPSLKRRLCHLAQGRAETKVLVAARSASLMKLGARLLYGPCRNVLITDLTWGPYERILRREQSKGDRRVTKLALRRELFRCQPAAAEIVERIAAAFCENQCDGLFLPLVDCFGVQLPVARIVERIRTESELRFVVVDGAQAINHVPLRLASDYSDFLLAGCHKWLQSFTPMGVGFFGRPRTVDYIQSSLARWQKRGIVDDPLLAFSGELESKSMGRFGESVAVSPLITSNAAVTDAIEQQCHDDVIANNSRIIESVATRDKGWSRISAGSDVSSRIMMLRARQTQQQALPPDTLRRRFHAHGISVSTYPRGRARLSVPASPLCSDDIRRLELAFSGCSVLSA